MILVRIFLYLFTFESIAILTVSGVRIGLHDLILVIIAFALIFKCVRGAGIQKKDRFTAVLLTYFLFIIIGSLPQEYFTSNLKYAIGLIQGLVLVSYVKVKKINIINLKKDLIVIAVILSIIAILHAWQVIDLPHIQKNPPSRNIFELSLFWKRTAGLLENYSIYNAYLLLGIVSIDHSYKATKGALIKTYLLLPYSIILIGSLIPQSRAMIITLFALLFLKVSLKYKKVMILLIVVFSFAFQSISESIEQVTSAFISMSQSSFLERADQFKLIWQILERNPFGIGLYGFEYETGNSMHNIFLNLTVSFGILAFPVVIFIIFRCVYLFNNKIDFSQLLEYNFRKYACLSLIVLFNFASGLSVPLIWIFLL